MKETIKFQGIEWEQCSTDEFRKAKTICGFIRTKDRDYFFIPRKKQ